MSSPGGKVERVADSGPARERRGGIAFGHGATFTATVSPSRMGTRVVTKSVAA